MASNTLLADWQDWPIEAKVKLRNALRALQHPSWERIARPDQLVGDAYLTVLAGGRGSGKTRGGAEWLADQLLRDDEGDLSAIVAPSFGEGRDKCVEGVSGLLPALRRRGVEPKWNRTLGELRLPNGAGVTVDEAYLGALKIQGTNLRRAWCDEVGLWRRGFAERAWDESLLPAVRLGSPQIVCTFTPKRTTLVKRLLQDPGADIRRMRTLDNAANLAGEFLEQMRRRYQGTRLGQQELEGILLEDVEGALWRFDWIEAARRAERPYTWQRLRVALDPADGVEDGAEHGIAVCGLGGDWQLYVLESDGLRCSPLEFCRHAIRVSQRHGNAAVVIEKNHGSEWLRPTFEEAMRDEGVTVPYHLITASRSKYARAEPVAMLYEQGKVSHLGVFPDLEEQMTSFTGAQNEKSPDRLDALVHGLTELMGGNIHGAVEPQHQTAVPWRDKPSPAGAVPWT